MSAVGLDVIVVGGGPAGLTAALILGRMRRSVLLADTGAPANAVSDAMHGFLAQDGVPPAQVRRVAAGQLNAYTSVERRSAAAVAARRVADGFEVEFDDGETATGQRLLLAHGMRYGLPEVEGLAELFGERVFHCPYCHGWEARDEPIAVYGSTERAVHQALLLTSLSSEVMVLAGGAPVADRGRQQLREAGVDVVDDAVRRVIRSAEGLRVEFATERADLESHALFVQAELSLATDLGPSLGAALAPNGSVATDEAGQSSVSGLYAAGDAGSPVQSVAVATGTGARSAYALNASLAPR